MRVEGVVVIVSFDDRAVLKIAGPSRVGERRKVAGAAGLSLGEVLPTSRGDLLSSGGTCSPYRRKCSRKMRVFASRTVCTIATREVH
jgi:hypothetical protein